MYAHGVRKGRYVEEKVGKGDGQHKMKKRKKDKVRRTN